MELYLTTLFQTTLVHLFHSLIVSIKENKNFISAAETSPLSGIKTCQIAQKTQETAHIFAADSGTDWKCKVI